MSAVWGFLMSTPGWGWAVLAALAAVVVWAHPEWEDVPLLDDIDAMCGIDSEAVLKAARS